MSDLPKNTHDFLYGAGDWRLPGEDGPDCAGARFHNPTPLFVLSTALVKREWWPENWEDWPEDEPGPGTPWLSAPEAWLCGTCRDNLDILLQMLHATDGDLAWPIRREFGNDLRALAVRGWTWFAEHPARPQPAKDG